MPTDELLQLFERVKAKREGKKPESLAERVKRIGDPGEDDTPVEAQKRQLLSQARSELNESILPPWLGVGLYGAGANTVSMLHRAIGDTEYADFMNRKTDALNQAAGEIESVQGMPWLSRTARGITQSLPNMAAAGALGGPPAAIAAASLQEANQAVTEGKDAGLSGAQLQAYVASQGIAEAVPAAAFQMVGLGGVEAVFGKAGAGEVKRGILEAGKRLGITMVPEQVEELGTSYWHEFNRATSGVDPNALDPDRLRQVAFDTFLQTAGTSAIVETPRTVRANLARKILGKLDAGEDPSRKDMEQWGSSREQRRTGPNRRKAAEDDRQKLEQEAANVGQATESVPAGSGVSVLVEDENDHAAKPAATTPIPRQPDSAPPSTPEVGVEEAEVDGSEPAGRKEPADVEPPWMAALPDDIKNATDEELRGTINGLNGTKKGKKGAVPKKTKRPELLEMVAEALGIAGRKPNVISFAKPEPAQIDETPEVTEKAPSPAKPEEPLYIGKKRRKSKLMKQAEEEVRARAEEIGVEPNDLVEAAYDAQEAVAPGVQDRREAKAFAHQHTGLQAYDIARIENDGHDHASGQAAGGDTGNKLAHFDANAAEVVSAYPHVFGNVDDAGRAVWDLLREEASQAPRINHPDVLAEAEAAVASADNYAPFNEDDQFRIGAREREQGHEVDVASIRQQFPGAKITPAKNGWHVEVGDSYFTIEKTPEIEVDWDAIEEWSGVRVPEKDRAALAPAGSFSVTMPDGTKHRGLGLIRLAEGMEDEDTLAHEALHMAREAGLFTPAEWQALVDKHAPGEASVDAQEEMIANAREDYRNPESVWGKIRDWIRGILNAAGITKTQARDVFRKMETAGFWRRKGTPRRQADTQESAPGEVADEADHLWESVIDKFEADKEKYQLKKVKKEVSIGGKRTDVRVYEVPFDPKILAKMRDGEVQNELETLEEARGVNASPERIAEWQQIYADAPKNGQPAQLLRKPADKGKLVGTEVITLTKGCQRTITTIERVENGILPEETRVEACYGGDCWVNKTLPVKWKMVENMEVRDLILPDATKFGKFFSPGRVKRLNKATFLREGYSGDSSHLFATGDAVAWLKAAKEAGVEPKTIFISASYAPVTDEQYAALTPYADQMEIHFSVSGWFHKNELMIRLAEFQAAKDAGLPATLRVISNKDDVSGIDMPNHAWMVGQMNKMGVKQSEVLETPFHDDDVPATVRKKDPGRWRSSPTGDFKYVCCETHACGTCKHKCMVKVAEDASSVQQTHVVDVPVEKVAAKTVEDEQPKQKSRGRKRKAPRKKSLVASGRPVVRKSPLSVSGRRKYSLRGRPDLANPGETSDARRAMDDADEQRNQEGRPIRRSRTESDAAAEKMLADDYEGTKQMLLERGRNSEPLNGVETLAAKKIFNQEASKAFASNDPQARVDLITLAEAWRNTGSEVSEAMRNRFDPVESPAERMGRALTEAILAPPARKRRRRDKLREQEAGDGPGKGPGQGGPGLGPGLGPGRGLKGGKTADDINREWAEETEKIANHLRALGFDLSELLNGKYSKRKSAEALRHVHHMKSSFPDMAYEYWRNAILSAPTTQAANLIGNLGHAAWSFGPERIVEATLNTLTRRPEGAQLGEFRHLAAGVVPGFVQGARNFAETFAMESPAFEASIGRAGKWRLEEPNTAIPGKAGKVLRLPQRILTAVDDWCKTMFTTMEVGAQAYRQAKAEGLSGEKMENRIAFLLADVESAPWRLAYDNALELAFQQDGGKTSQAFKGAALSARGVPGVRYLIPFVVTPVNIFATGLKKTPLGSVEAAYHMYDNYREGRHVMHGMAPRIAQQVLAGAAVYALMGLLDDKEPIITGSEGMSSPGGRELSYRAIPPQSVRIGDKWYSYSRIEPFATALSLVVDGINSIGSKDSKRVAEAAFDGVAGQLSDKTFLSGLGDMFRVIAADGRRPEEAMKWATNFSASWIPNLVRSASRESDETYMNRRVWGNGQDWWERASRRVAQKTELAKAARPDYPYYDVWGRPSERTEAPVGSDFLWRVLVPVKTQKAEMFVADRLMVNWNNRNPNKVRYPSSPMPYYQRGGETVYMSDKQYAEYSRLAGEVSRHALTNSDLIKLDADNPTLGATTWINEVCTKSRSAVKDRLIKKWSGEDVTVDPAELGGEVREKALGSIAYSIARGEDETETTKAKARMIKELGVDKVKLSNILRQKLIKSSWDQGHKAKSATLRDWQRRLAFRLAQADKN